MSLEAPMMAALAMASVGLWTLRVTTAAQGRKLAGAVIAAVEAVVFALTFSHLVTDLGSPDRLAGYALGVAAGTALGLVVNDRLKPGHTELQLVAAGYVPEVVEELGIRGWPVTWSAAFGPSGPVTQIAVTVDDVAISALVADVAAVAPDAFWTLRSLRAANPSPLPEGCRQIHARRLV